MGLRSEQYDLAAFDALLQTDPRPLLIGGQAVNLWAQVFLRNSTELAAMQPFVSKDCDLYGDQEIVRNLARRSSWKSTFSRKGQASPVCGYLTHPDGAGGLLLVEVLHTVRGLCPKDLEEVVVVELGHRVYHTLSPVNLLKAKLANVVEIGRTASGEVRNDLAHLRILIPCVAAYLVEAMEEVKAGRSTQRSYVNLLERVLGLVRSEYADRVKGAYSFDLFGCFPKGLAQCELAKVRRFVQHRLAK